MRAKNFFSSGQDNSVRQATFDSSATCLSAAIKTTVTLYGRSLTLGNSIAGDEYSRAMEQSFELFSQCLVLLAQGLHPESSQMESWTNPR